MSADAEPRLRVLIVEDEWLLAELLEDTVRDLGFEVVGPAASVSQALQLLAEEAVSVALLDVTLGSEKSFPIARWLAERGIPFLFLTGHLQTDLPVEFGQRVLLSKPLAEGVLGPQLFALI